MGFTAGGETVVEVVAVLEKAVPKGRSELGIELPQVAVPVLEHRWRVLLPEVNRYRFREGVLRPASVPAVLRPCPPAGGLGFGRSRDFHRRHETVSGLGGNSSVIGMLVDDQGSALPGASRDPHRCRNAPHAADLGLRRGSFRFITLPPGSYFLEAQLEGFSSVQYPNVQVTSASNVQLEITMSSAVEDTITVTAESPLLDERSTSRTETIPLNQGGGGGPESGVS